MAFSFGSTGQSTFGAAAPKPTGFGTPFGAVPTTTTNTAAFGGAAGGFGSTFGTGTQAAAPAFGAVPQQQQPQQQPVAAAAFGSTFGAAAPGAAPAFGSTFGTTSATSAPAFGGTTFGAPAATSAAPFGFGTSTGGATGAGLFGTTTTTKPSLFGTPTTTTSLFSTPAATAPSLFGTTTTTQAPSLFGTVSTSTTPSLFGTTATSAPSLFGSTFGTGGGTTTTAPGGGGLFGSTTSTPGFGLFGTGPTVGATTTTAPSLFGGFGGATQTPAFSGFGTGAGGGFAGFRPTAPSTVQTLFGPKPITAVPGVPLTQQQQQNQQIIQSIYSITIFNDERDDILKKWNLLQACWGTGKGYYNANLPPVDYNIYNQFYRFKAIGYNVVPEHDNAEGIVKLIFNRKFSELNNQKEVLINGIGGILGNKPNLKVIIQNIKAQTDTQTEIRIVVMEKGVTGFVRRIPATDLAAFLNQPTQKQQLTNVGVLSIIPYVTPSKAAMDEYLKIVPLGFAPEMWKAAITDNPNPSKFMPVPIYGFSDLKARKLKQEYENGLHKAFEEKLNTELVELKKKHAASIARINELKQRFFQLQHRTLRILVRQESIRKAGLAIEPQEDYLKGKLETMYAQINIPTQFKGQLKELISTVRLRYDGSKMNLPRYKLVPESQTELKEFLTLQQNGIAKLMEIVKEDIKNMNVITEGMQQILQSKNVLP